MNHYKSWSGLNNQLTDFLCDEFKDRISFFLTRYHKVHDAYGRAAILLDGKELVCFSWIESYHRYNILYEAHEKNGVRWDYYTPEMIEKWNENAIYSDWNFLSAATSFLEMPIDAALKSDDYVIRIFAILDRRVGKRTLKKIKEQGDYQTLPEWVKQFYELRLSLLKMP
ncbi:MAG: hypothetical protein HDR19_08420 [Lachnospiraceae bacterium]|nr:hypothetical protein [Lachnospiraceae bacterium]